MRPRYYLHGDQEDTDSQYFYCRKCDIFAESLHFQTDSHQSVISTMLKNGLTFLADSEKTLRSKDWPNLFENKLLLARYDLELQLAKMKMRKEVIPSIRFSVLKRDKSTCQLCGRDPSNGVTLHVDHRIPLAKGGTNDLDNLWVLCSDCNLGKGVSDL